jgi:serine/threonine protein kinase
MHIKFSDFGSAKVCKEQKTRNRRGTLVGTMDYAPPEVILTQESDTTADLWSLGCVLYELFAGKPPFRSSEDEKTREKILWGELLFPDSFPELAKDLCLRLIRLEKEKRLGSDSFNNLREHGFFAGIDFQNLQRNKPMNEIAHQAIPKSVIDEKQGVNYATISPSKSYEISYDYYAEDSQLFRNVDCELVTTKILKEGFVSKECGWISYKKVNLILTDEPKLTYYSVLNVYMVFYYTI